jgi:hypothetical protein
MCILRLALKASGVPQQLRLTYHQALHDSTITLSMTKHVFPGKGTQRIGVGGGKEGDVGSGWHEVSRVQLTAEGGVPFPSSHATVDLPQCNYLTENHNEDTEQGRIGPNRRRRRRATI